MNRDRAVPGDPDEKDCPDWHWIQYLDGTCSWEDMDGHFEIGRSALRLHTPLTNGGDIDCVNQDGERKFPKLDYSKGFPDWWYLSETSITVPSEHVQHGKRYAAEVKLSHFYEIDHYKNKLGIISIFMQDFEGEPSWAYLDKLICRWRREEEKKRAECGLPPAPVYKMCELYRGQVRTPEDLNEPTQTVLVPTVAPLVAPPAIPIVNFGGDPEEFRLPLKLCEGDCDFVTDCAPGLICFQRDAFEEVPGCIGGGQDYTNTDYCVFDPFGAGYDGPTLPPTTSPTVTARPTITPLTPIPLTDFGGTPPSMPLQLCQGDCDRDEDCAFGLICFQRTSFEAVPGCIGGDADFEKTDYCILDPFGPGYDTRLDAVPTLSPSLVSSPTGQLLRIQNVGWEVPGPLGECAGDCDSDEDCGQGMQCFQRNSPYQSVPGCLGGEEDPTLTDYCIRPTSQGGPPISLPPSSPPPSSPPPSTDPVSQPIPAPPTSSATDLPPLKDLGWTPPMEARPLGRCEGDCDIRQDCGPGLDCFQRYLPNVAVPGCSGGELDSTLTDYCVPAELINVVPQEAPLVTSIPQVVPTMAPVSQVTTAPQLIPTFAPIVAGTVAPAAQTIAPFDGRVDNATDGTLGVPPAVDCAAFAEVNINRMCKDDSCCKNPRSTSEFCQDSYVFLGDATQSVCHHCCMEKFGEALAVGPAPVANPSIPQVVQCDAVTQPNRICNAGSSCCDSSGERSEFCQELYAQYSSEEVESICWYCCYPSMVYSVGSRRELSTSESTNIKQLPNNDTLPLRENDIITYDAKGRRVIVRAENFEEKGLMDEDAYFDELFSNYQHRALQTTTAVENYDDVHWWPYEWFLKVGTEYYFRYEGTDTVPPCFDTAHWRVYKDPIRVSPHQMRELERLIAWRLGDQCQVDTAGKPTASPDAVDVARPLQSYHRLHRMVFCECKDWPSKFPGDRQWCRNWQTNPAEERLFQNPYNFPSNGFDFL